MTKKCIVASCMVVDGGKLLLLMHRKLGAWLPPGGHVEDGEFPYEAAARETREETGLDVEIFGSDEVKHIYDGAHTLEVPFIIVYEDVPYKDEAHIHFDMVYMAKVKGGALAVNADENTELRWFGIDELRVLDTFPNVRDVAVAALERYG